MHDWFKIVNVFLWPVVVIGTRDLSVNSLKTRELNSMKNVFLHNQCSIP